MASSYYIADDGTIHSRPVPAGTRAGETPGTENEVSGTRKAAFWIITLAVSLFIGSGMYQLVGEPVFGAAEEGANLWDSFFAAAGPWIMKIGSLGGSVFYGISLAERGDYGPGTYFFSALSSLVGMAVFGLTVIIIAFILEICVYIALIVMAVGVVCTLLGGS